MKPSENFCKNLLQQASFFLNNHRRVCFGLSLLLVVILGWLDHMTRYEFGFLVFYFVPIVMAAWYVGLYPAMIVAFASTAAWFLADYNAYRYSSEFYRYWNMGIRLVTFLVNALTTATIRRNVDGYRKMRLERNKLLEQIEETSSLLPVCRSCGEFRDDEDYRELLSRYVRARTETGAPGGLCPDCARKSAAAPLDKGDPRKKGR